MPQNYIDLNLHKRQCALAALLTRLPVWNWASKWTEGLRYIPRDEIDKYCSSAAASVQTRVREPSTRLSALNGAIPHIGNYETAWLLYARLLDLDEVGLWHVRDNPADKIDPNYGETFQIYTSAPNYRVFTRCSTFGEAVAHAILEHHAEPIKA